MHPVIKHTIKCKVKALGKQVSAAHSQILQGSSLADGSERMLDNYLTRLKPGHPQPHWLLPHPCPQPPTQVLLHQCTPTPTHNTHHMIIWLVLFSQPLAITVSGGFFKKTVQERSPLWVTPSITQGHALVMAVGALFWQSG
jgi:hypothetical protein